MIGTTLNVVVYNKDHAFTEKQILDSVAMTLTTLQKMINEAELENQLFNSGKLNKNNRLLKIEEVSFKGYEDALEIIQAIYSYVTASIEAMAPMLATARQEQIEEF